MYHEEQQQSHRSRSRCRDKPRRKTIPVSDPSSIDCDLVSMGRAHGEGSVQFRKRIYATKILDSSCGSGLPIEENSFALEFRRSSSKKANGTPIKTLIGEDMSKEVEIRRPSPGVIGRLMGLDTMPPPHVVPIQQKEMGNFQKTSTIGFQEKYVTYEDHSLRMSTNEHQEFKDVFEVVETSKVVKHMNQTVRKGMSSRKPSETDMAFIKQKLMDAEHLLTDETHQNSKDFNDALEVLDYNKDLFLKFLQEPNSLFTKHLHDLKCAPPSRHASHITVLKSKGTKCETSEISCTSGRNAERGIHVQSDVISSYRKPTTSYACHSLKEHSCYLPDKLSESRYAGKTEAYEHPTRIVVLKPSLETAENMARHVPLGRSHEDFQFSCKRHREFPRPGIRELYSKGRDRYKMSDNEDVIGHKTKRSREIAREYTKQLRHTISSGSEKVLISKFNGSHMDKSSSIRSDMANMKKYESFRWSSDHFDECVNSFSSSSSYSTESSVNREARKRLSERWKMTHRFQEVGLVGRGSSTLGEMLALSDNEKPKTTMDPFITQAVPKKKVARDEALATWGCPFGISSDGWKNRCLTNMPTALSLPPSSTDYGNPKLSSRNYAGGSDNCYMLEDVLNMGPYDSVDGKFSRKGSSSLRSFKYHSNKPRFYSVGEEDKLLEREIHVSSEERRNRTRVGYLAEEDPMIPEISEDVIADKRHMADHFSVPKCSDVKFPSITNEVLVKRPATLTLLAKDGAFSGYKQEDFVMKEISINHPQVDSVPSQCDIPESESPVSSDETGRPSPVSVLEPPSEEEKPSSGCFGKVSADLQELRMQLQLLKLENADKFVEDLQLLISSDEESEGECYSKILQPFSDEEDRDFSYLLDIVIESGVHGTDWNMLFDASYSPEYPVGADVFDKLEKKYSLLVSWSRTERKLLFDLTNAILVDSIVPYMDLHPWVKPERRFGPTMAREGFVEEVWQIVVRQRKEPSSNLEEKLLESRWLDLGNDVDMIGREIERMLKEDLLEELVSELIL